MTEIELQIRKRLDALPPILHPLRDFTYRYLDRSARIEPSVTLCIGHRPVAGPAWYHFRLFPPAPAAWLSKFERRLDIEIPLLIQILLRQLNGFFALGFSCYGLPPSMMEDPPLLDRTVVQPLDLHTANESWRNEYKGVRSVRSHFYFGGRHYNHTENVGYFVDRNDHIHSFRKCGEQVGSWRTITTFLEDELAASEREESESAPS